MLDLSQPYEHVMSRDSDTTARMATKDYSTQVCEERLFVKRQSASIRSLKSSSLRRSQVEHSILTNFRYTISNEGDLVVSPGGNEKTHFNAQHRDS